MIAISSCLGILVQQLRKNNDGNLSTNNNWKFVQQKQQARAITEGLEDVEVCWGNTPLVVPVGSPLSLLSLGKNKINTKPYP